MKISSPTDLVDTIAAVINLEIEAINHLHKNIDYQAISATLELVNNCKGRVVFCGLGKSGHIAKKIAATWSSTGTPSIFLHAGEALHGDLGILQPNDLLITVSNSGESDEILRIVPVLQRLKLPHIAWVGNLNSTLARNADLCVYVGAEKELLENYDLGMVPLASCLTTLAMGDILTVLLVQQKGFAPDDFRLFHPAGNIGQKLLLPVAERMQRENLPTATLQTNMRELLISMTRGSFGLVVLCDAVQKIEAIITDGDIRRALQAHGDRDFFALSAAQIATFQPKTIATNANLWQAEQLMNAHKINALPVFAADTGVFVGIIAKHQL